MPPGLDVGLSKSDSSSFGPPSCGFGKARKFNGICCQSFLSPGVDVQKLSNQCCDYVSLLNPTDTLISGVQVWDVAYGTFWY